MHKYQPKSFCLDLFALFGKILNIYYPNINKLMMKEINK